MRRRTSCTVNAHVNLNYLIVECPGSDTIPYIGLVPGSSRYFVVIYISNWKVTEHFSHIASKHLISLDQQKSKYEIKLVVKKDLQTHYSVELTVQINVAIGPVCRPLSLEGRRGTGLWTLAWVCLEIW